MNAVSGQASVVADRTHAEALAGLVESSEAWLMRRVLEYALRQGYTRYTSTLEEAWRASVRGLSACLAVALRSAGEVRDLTPDERYDTDPTAAFGISEARIHRSRGIRLDMFLGLMKYYQQAYLDLVEKPEALPAPARAAAHRWISRFFDRVELGFVSEWTTQSTEGALVELQERSRDLTNQKNFYLTIFESLASPAFLLDPGGRLFNANSAGARMLGIQASPGVGSYGSLAAFPEALGWLAADLARLDPARPETTEAEHVVETTSGPRRFLVRIQPMLDVSEKFQGVTVLMSEVTELRRAEEAARLRAVALERSNADLDRFAYVVSHDLQEPLRMMGSFAELLSRRYVGRIDGDADEFLHYIRDGAARMKGLIDGLLGFSRVGSRPLTLAAVPADESLDAAIQNLRLAIAEAGARIERGLLPVVQADATQLTQVFQNLIANALKFRRGEPALVAVSARRVGADWRFEVADNGLGIPAAEQGRVFEVFHRVPGREELPGQGVGLAVCKRAVERHGGEIWVDSEPGRGSTFCFTLPAGMPPAGQAKPSPSGTG